MSLLCLWPGLYRTAAPSRRANSAPPWRGVQSFKFNGLCLGSAQARILLGKPVGSSGGSGVGPLPVALAGALRGRSPAIRGGWFQVEVGARPQFGLPLAERRHSTDGLTKLTAADTATFTRLAGLRVDNGRPLFAVTSFEGAMGVSGDGKLQFRVGAHLLRFVLLDVDGSMPILSAPSRDSTNNHAICDGP